MLSNKELRDMIFSGITIAMAISIAVTSIKSANIFGIVTSIVLLSMLCVGLGYQYCKNEEKIADLLARAKNEKAEKAKAIKKKNIFVSEDIIENSVDKSKEV